MILEHDEITLYTSEIARLITCRTNPVGRVTLILMTLPENSETQYPKGFSLPKIWNSIDLHKSVRTTLHE